VASGEIEAVKSREHSMAKLVVGEWGTDVRRGGSWGMGGPCTRKIG
jgi:hypothetical protein